MTADRLLQRARAAVVKERPPDAQPPARWRPDFIRQAGLLRNGVAGADVVQHEIGKERYDLPAEQRIRDRTGLERRDMAGGAADRGEELFARPRPRVLRSARRRREELHERFEIVDRCQT